MVRSDPWGGLPTAFDPPEEDADDLLDASRAAEQAVRDHHRLEGAARYGVATAAATWAGPRYDTFVRASADAQSRIRTLADHSAAMAGLLHRYAHAVREAEAEIGDLRAAYLRQLEIAADEHDRARRAEEEHRRQLAPYGLDNYGLGATTTSPEAQAATERALDAERRAAVLTDDAEDAQRRLRRQASGFLTELAALNDRTVPGGGLLSPADVARRVHETSGLGGSTTAPGSVLSALRMLDGAGHDIPVTAIRPDGSVDWSRVGERAVPKRGTAPGQVASWWGGLATWQQAVLLEEYAADLGNLDGLPAHVRDQANRAMIATFREQLEEQVADLANAMPNLSVVQSRGGYLPELQDLRRVEAKLAALTAVEKVLAKPGARQLLVLDPFDGEQLHAAVGIGDVDTARHVTVFTPGFKTSVQRKLDKYDEDMSSLRLLAQQFSKHLGDGGDVATVTWIGYDAPQSDEVLEAKRSVIASKLAKSGGDRLAPFLAGINTARPGRPVHLTGLAHSYGSLTFAYALRHPDTGVEEGFMFGSPGLGVSRASDLHLPPGHLLELEAPDDRTVADSGWFGTDASDLPGIQRMQTRAADTPVGRTTASHGHGEYLKPGSTSQYNIAVVVAGLDSSYLVPAGGEVPEASKSPDWWRSSVIGPGR